MYVYLGKGTYIIVQSHNFYDRITTRILVSILSINTYILVCIHIFIFFIKVLTKVYTMRDIKPKNDRPHGIVNNNVGIIISILQILISVVLS